MNFRNDGHAVGNIADEVLRLFDGGKIHHEEAFALLKTCEKGTKWSGEYLFPMSEHRCGCCLRKAPEGDAVFSLYKVFSSSNGCARVPSEVQERVFGYLVCEDCIRELSSDYFDEESFEQLDFDLLKIDFGNIPFEDLDLFCDILAQTDNKDESLDDECNFPDDFSFDGREEYEAAMKERSLIRRFEEEDVDEEPIDEEEPQPLFGIDLGVSFSVGRVGKGTSHRE